MFPRQVLLAVILGTVAGSVAQLLSADFTECLESAAQAPDEQKLNIIRVYAQLDTGRESGGSDGDNTNHQALLRLVALGETGVRSEGFSNTTNFLGEESACPLCQEIMCRRLIWLCSLAQISQPPWWWRLRSCRLWHTRIKPRCVPVSLRLRN